MNLTHAEVYSKLRQINQHVQDNLKKQGIVIPKKNADGSISIGKFKIVKSNGFFTVLNYDGEYLYENINLPQTAAVLANDLAIRHFVNRQILEVDRKYGHAAFEESYQNKLLSKKNLKEDFKDVIRSKIGVARAKKEFYKAEIEDGFKKLIRIR